jgi:hypothetical protein
MGWISTAIGGVALALLASLGANAPAAAQATSHNFLISLSCFDSDVEVRAEFTVPSRQTTAGIIGHAPQGDYPIWIDLSVFNNNFAPRTFLGFGPLAPPQGEAGYAIVWEGLVTDRAHYYRLNAFIDGRWRELGRGRFETPDCLRERAFTCDHTDDVTIVFELPRSRASDQRAAIHQWLDLTLDPTFDFAPGTFVGAGPFPPPLVGVEGERTLFGWSHIRPGLVHNYRVNVLEDNGNWDTQVRAGFQSPDCRDIPPTEGLLF